MRIFLIIMAYSLLFSGCMSDRIVKFSTKPDQDESISYDEFNDMVSSRSVTIELKNNEKYKAQNTYALNDTVSFSSDSLKYYKAINEIHQINYPRSVVQGIIYGFLDGFLIGAVLGGPIGSVVGSGKGELGSIGDFFQGIVLGSTLGALLGMTYKSHYPALNIILFDANENTE